MIINELAHRGHNVTVVSPYSNKNAPPRAHYIPFGDDFQSNFSEYVKDSMNSNETMNSLWEQLVVARFYVTIYSRRYFYLIFFIKRN